MNAYEMTAKCAPCLAALCGHKGCPDSAMDAVTAVAGTPSCGDCAGALMELVLHPPAPLVVTVPPPGPPSVPPASHRRNVTGAG